jgi:hypothetical protein
MQYSSDTSDLLLLFRKTSSQVYVEVDLGSVTNLLNLSGNSVVDLSTYGYISNQVLTSYSSSFTNVLFTVIGVAGLGDPSGVWVTDFSDTSAPANMGSSAYSNLRGTVDGIGSDADNATGFTVNSNFVSSAGTANETYDYLLTTAVGQSQSSMPTFGGNLKFTDEALAGKTQNFYQLSSSSSGTGTLIGTFNMNATNGVIVFTRTGTGVTLVPAQIVGVASAGGGTQISFTTTNGNNYQLLYKTNLTQVGWLTNATAGKIAGNNSITNFSDISTDPQRFYRIQSF